jgi:hypothetical protein
MAQTENTSADEQRASAKADALLITAFFFID